MPVMVQRANQCDGSGRSRRRFNCNRSGCHSRAAQMTTTGLGVGTVDPQWITAACAAAGLLITWTTSTAGAAIWLMRRLDAIKKEILDDFDQKHSENSK